MERLTGEDRKSTRLNSSHMSTSYAVFCLKKKTTKTAHHYRQRLLLILEVIQDLPLRSHASMLEFVGASFLTMHLLQRNLAQFVFKCSAPVRYLRSVPTRRSSD